MNENQIDIIEMILRKELLKVSFSYILSMNKG